MLYGIVSYIRSLFIVGFLISVGYILFIYANNQNYVQKLDLLYLLLSIGWALITFFYIRFWKYIIMPYSLNFHGIFSHNTYIQTRNRRTLFLDFFLNKYKVKPKSILEDAYLKKMLNKFALEFSNFTSIDIDNYRSNKEKILHFLGLIKKDYEVSIYPIRKKSVQLIFYKLPTFYEYNFFTTVKLNFIFLGIYENGLLFRDFTTLDHHLVIGESGSGKSNLMQLLNINFLLNHKKIKKIFMIDLKGGVELKRFEKIPFVEFVSNIERLDSLLSEVIEDMKQTQEFMLQENKRLNDIFTLIIFDEFGAISSYPDKKTRDSIFQKLALISMQGRSSKHLLFMFGQKVDNTTLPSNIVNNLQSRVLLKTSNDNNINIIDLKDNIREKITQTEIQDFPIGRAIYKNGQTSEKYLTQFPFISDSTLNSFISSYSKK